MALQLDHTQPTADVAFVFSSNDRAGAATISARLGPSKPASEVGPDFDFSIHVVEDLTAGDQISYLKTDGRRTPLGPLHPLSSHFTA